MQKRLLIVDDDERFAASLVRSLNQHYSTARAHSFQEAEQLFDPSSFDAVLLDIRLEENSPDKKDGLELLKLIKREAPDLPVLIMTAYGDVDTAVESLKIGAEDFIQKTRFSPADYRRALDRLFQHGALRRKALDLEKRLRQLEPSELIGEDSKIQEIKKLISLVSQDGQATVLIRGETGTGKELVAQAVHRQGIRRDAPFVTVSLPALPMATIESELFGHERGAFTGAIERRMGFIEEARGGILFLDEIGDLPQEIQVKLLRFLEAKEFTCLGSNKQIQVNVQILAATNQPLEEMVKARAFREDLYYRFKVFEIFLPPLRERRGDIPLLSQHFLSLLAGQGRTKIKDVGKETVPTLINYSWPGNIRELKQALEYAVLKAKLTGANTILPEHLPLEIAGLLAPTPAPVHDLEKGEMHLSLSEKNAGIFRILAETELRYVRHALKTTGKKSDAWRLLGYHDRFSLRRRVAAIFSKYPDLKKSFPEVHLASKQKKLFINSS